MIHVPVDRIDDLVEICTTLKRKNVRFNVTFETICWQVEILS